MSELAHGRNLAAMLVDAHIAATDGNRRALAYGEKSYSFHDLAALMNRAGNMLRALGVERGSRVLILLSPSPALFGTILGAIKIGAIAIVADQAPAAAMVRGACERNTPVAAIVEGARLGELLTALGEVKVVVAGEAHGDYPALVELLRAAPSSLAAEAVEEATPALIVLRSGRDAIAATHGELVREAGDRQSLGLRLGRLEFSAALAHLARCDEVSIPAS